MNQSNTSSLQGSEVPFESQRGEWKLKSPKMKIFLEEEKGRRKEVGFAIRRRRLNRENINI